MNDTSAAASAAAAVATSYAALTAPFDGLVTEKLTEPGNMAGAGMPLLTIEDTASFRLEVRLDESRASFVRPGDRVDVVVTSAAGPATPDGPVTPPARGRVAEVARAMEAGAHDFLVKIALPDTPGLRSGMFGRARFPGPARRALAVPDAAVVRRGQLAFVFVAEPDGVARLRLVNVSPAAGGLVEIRAGLIAGERVITGPPADLADGSAVTSAGGRGRPAEAR